MRMLISGATGTIGQCLMNHWKLHHDCAVLTTRPGRASKIWPSGVEIFHSPAELIQADPFDAVINFSGADIAGRRWTQGYRQELWASRVDYTKRLVEVFSSQRIPRLWINASAIGFYGEGGESWLQEDSPVGKGFASQLCEAWEHTVALDTRVVYLRLAPVLSVRGSILGRLKWPYRCGLGGPLGDGQQWFSWIHWQDVLSLMDRILESNISGPVNAVAPSPVRQCEFAKTFAGLLHRPAKLFMPKSLVRLLFGQMGEELLLSSQRVRSQFLDEFPFQYPDLESALSSVVRVWSDSSSKIT